MIISCFETYFDTFQFNIVVILTYISKIKLAIETFLNIISINEILGLGPRSERLINLVFTLLRKKLL